MNMERILKERRSIRKFKAEKISDSTINELIEAARLAPSGSNKQPVRYVIVKSDEMIKELGECTSVPFVSKAPLVLVCCVDKKTYKLSNASKIDEIDFSKLSEQEKAVIEYNKKRSEWDDSTLMAYLYLNAGISLEHVVLKAVDLGLGSCWIRLFDVVKVKRMLKLEDRYEVVALLPVGYPDEEPIARPRIDLEEVILKTL
ncbi:nitroreductase [Clostridium zeae]|uniref:Nitroreductase n=1 Tax=Clostridium zeae TaxID=2759022 RepID=A0ABQ1E4T3_9CLOT|nr:nitroreductase family protein [Clostridium zeae]GFZ29754.1 nitroreductase [Clostridium zeae]